MMSIFLLTEDELHADYWNNKGKQALHSALNIQPNIRQAKNLILFLGDGESVKMSLTIIHGVSLNHG